MSVIAALISTRDGVTASDGRRFEAVVPPRPPSVESDDFDKTFSLAEGKVIGAFCGLLEFSGATVAEHIRDITASIVTKGTSFLEVVSLVQRELTARLNRVDDLEVMPAYRSVDLLLVGGVNLTRKDMRIAGVRFRATQDGVVADPSDVVSAGEGNRYYVYGEDLARAAAKKVFDDDHVASKASDQLLKLVSKAVDAGIQGCGVKAGGAHRACGGQIFTERTWY
jgi:hypothetical protein